jgi:hypothetical protein
MPTLQSGKKMLVRYALSSDRSDPPGRRPAMQPQAMPASAGGRRPPWSKPADAARLFLRGITVRPCVPVALVVGCVLSAINEGAVVVTGRAGSLTWVQIGLNFVVPFLVSSYGYLAAARVPR